MSRQAARQRRPDALLAEAHGQSPGRAGLTESSRPGPCPAI